MVHLIWQRGNNPANPTTQLFEAVRILRPLQPVRFASRSSRPKDRRFFLLTMVFVDRGETWKGRVEECHHYPGSGLREERRPGAVWKANFVAAMMRKRRREAIKVLLECRLESILKLDRAERFSGGGQNELEDQSRAINKKGCSPPRVTPLRSAVELTPAKRCHE